MTPTPRFPRSSGVLLHLTSLPSPHGSGDLGSAAYHFIDWLHAAGQSVWQFLPLGGIGLGGSPYMSSSAFAGNVLLIDLTELHRRGWLEADVDASSRPSWADAISMMWSACSCRSGADAKREGKLALPLPGRFA